MRRGLLLLVLLTSCNEGPARVCEPGRVVDCPCAGGQRSTQTCSPDGMSFLPCLCTEPAPAPTVAPAPSEEAQKEHVSGRLVAPRATKVYSLDEGGVLVPSFAWNTVRGPTVQVSIRDVHETEDRQMKVVAHWPGLPARGTILMSFPESAGGVTVHLAARDSGQLMVRYEDPPHSQDPGSLVVHVVEWNPATNRAETTATWRGVSEEYHSGRAPRWTRMWRERGE